MVNLLGGYGITNPHDVRDANAMQNAYHEMMLRQANAMQNAPSIYDLCMANYRHKYFVPEGWRDWYAIGDQLP